MQVTQQVYVAEDWVQNAHNKFDAEAQSRREVEKTQLAEKLKAAESARQSAEAGLKTIEAQAEDQCKQLHTTQINLATEKVAVLDQKTELQKAQEALKVAKEAAKVAEAAAYKRGVVETEARLTAEVTVVYRDYCAKTYYKTHDRGGDLTDFDLRRADKVYYPEDIRQDPTALPPPAALPLPPPEQPFITQDPSQGIEIPVGVQIEKMGDVGVSRPNKKAKEEAKGKVDANPFEDILTIEDMVSKAKTVESKSKIDSKKNTNQSQTQIQGFSFVFAIFVMTLCFQM